MSYKLTFTDDQNTYTFDILQIPIKDTDIEGASDNTTLNGNVYTDFLYIKKEYQNTFAWLSEEEYAILDGFYRRQFTNGKYPLMTMTELGVDNLPVRLNITNGGIVDNCGTRTNVKLTMRETDQL